MGLNINNLSVRSSLVLPQLKLKGKKKNIHGVRHQYTVVEVEAVRSSPVPPQLNLKGKKKNIHGVKH